MNIYIYIVHPYVCVRVRLRTCLIEVHAPTPYHIIIYDCYYINCVHTGRAAGVSGVDLPPDTSRNVPILFRAAMDGCLLLHMPHHDAKRASFVCYHFHARDFIPTADLLRRIRLISNPTL